MNAMDLILLSIMLVSSLWAIMARSLIRGAIGLAAASLVLTLIMFRLGSPLAAVFELSVCAGLITVVFISTISLTQPMSEHQKQAHGHSRIGRYLLLPVLLVVAAACLALFCKQPADLPITKAAAPTDVRTVLWNLRQLDLLGQVVILLTGIYAVIVLFKRKKTHE